MRICMTVLNTFRHDARVHREATALAAAGHELLVLALEDPALPEHESVAGYKVRRIPVRTRSLPNSAPARMIQYLEYVIRTLCAALAWKADVYHAHDANTLSVAAVAAWLRRAGLVYDTHELEADRNWGSSNLPLFVRKLWTLPERLFIRRAHAVITVCDSIAGELQALYRVETPHVVRNIPETQYVGEPVDLRQVIGRDDGPPIVLYQGGMQANRGIEQMIDAMTLLDDAALVLLGAGPTLASMRAGVKRNELNDRVFFLGHVPLAELPSYTAGGNVGVHVIQNSCLNHFYCLPNKLFEYIHTGLPVVVSDFPEMARIVRTYEVGELVDPSDPAEIAAAIERILGDREYYRRLRENAQRAAAVLTWEQESKRLLAVYQGLETSRQ